MSDWEPGTVALATVRGVPNVRVVRGHKAWITTPAPQPHEKFPCTYSAIYDNSGHVTDIRPLVVLDLSPHEVFRAIEALRGSLGMVAMHVAEKLEAATTPPKPDEPTGLGAVIQEPGSDGLEWVRVPLASNDARWFCGDTGEWREYRDISVGRVLSEGWSR